MAPRAIGRVGVMGWRSNAARCTRTTSSTRHDGRMRWNWYVVVAVFFVLGPKEMVPVPEELWVRVALPLGLVLGALWQVLSRRDLADRLTLLSVLTVGSATLSLVPGLRVSLVQLLSSMGVIAGLVLTERFLRQREARANHDAHRVMSERLS